MDKQKDSETVEQSGASVPSMEGARQKGVVIGYFAVRCAEGDEFIKAHARFYDGELFHHIFDATVYTGDKFTIGGREITRQGGEELWIVRFGAKKEEIVGGTHSEAPNDQAVAPAEGGSPPAQS